MKKKVLSVNYHLSIKYANANANAMNVLLKYFHREWKDFYKRRSLF